jgi:hypothetical protein
MTGVLVLRGSFPLMAETSLIVIDIRPALGPTQWIQRALSNSLEHTYSSSWEANSGYVGQQIQRISFWNPKGSVPSLKQPTSGSHCEPVHTTPRRHTASLRPLFYIIFPSPKCSVPFRFSTNILQFSPTFCYFLFILNILLNIVFSNILSCSLGLQAKFQTHIK